MVQPGLTPPPPRSLAERIREVADLMIEEEGRKLTENRRTEYEEGRSQGMKDACRVVLLELEEA